MTAPGFGPWTLALAALAVAPVATAGPDCTDFGPPVVLTRALAETSGIAVGRTDPEVLWTHNDGHSELYGLDRSGQVLESFALPVRLSDWEDLEIADCPSAGSCLYVADTGDNGERRAGGHTKILRIAEPAVGLSVTGSTPLRAEVFPIRLPDGPRDVEAMFVLPGESIHLISKGANHPVTVYRYPGVLRADTVTLEEVQSLTDGPVPLLDRVTAAAASVDGDRVAVRTYGGLRFYRPLDGRLVPTGGPVAPPRSVVELQGEAVGLGPDGEVVLTSEGGPLGGPPSMRLLRCRL